MSRLPVSIVLRLDGWACVLLGVALIPAAGALTGPAGLTSAWPVWSLGAVLIAYGVENLLVARRPSPLAVRVLAGVDLAVVAAAATVIAADPTRAAVWVRGGLLALGLASLAMAAAKLAGARTLAQAPRRTLASR